MDAAQLAAFRAAHPRYGDWPDALLSRIAGRIAVGQTPPTPVPAGAAGALPAPESGFDAGAFRTAHPRYADWSDDTLSRIAARIGPMAGRGLAVAEPERVVTGELVDEAPGYWGNLARGAGASGLNLVADFLAAQQAEADETPVPMGWLDQALNLAGTSWGAGAERLRGMAEGLGYEPTPLDEGVLPWLGEQAAASAPYLGAAMLPGGAALLGPAYGQQIVDERARLAGRELGGLEETAARAVGPLVAGVQSVGGAVLGRPLAEFARRAPSVPGRLARGAGGGAVVEGLTEALDPLMRAAPEHVGTGTFDLEELLKEMGLSAAVGGALGAPIGAGSAVIPRSPRGAPPDPVRSREGWAPPVVDPTPDAQPPIAAAPAAPAAPFGPAPVAPAAPAQPVDPALDEDRDAGVAAHGYDETLDPFDMRAPSSTRTGPLTYDEITQAREHSRAGPGAFEWLERDALDEAEANPAVKRYTKGTKLPGVYYSGTAGGWRNVRDPREGDDPRVMWMSDRADVAGEGSYTPFEPQGDELARDIEPMYAQGVRPPAVRAGARVGETGIHPVVTRAKHVVRIDGRSAHWAHLDPRRLTVEGLGPIAQRIVARRVNEDLVLPGAPTQEASTDAIVRSVLKANDELRERGIAPVDAVAFDGIRDSTTMNPNMEPGEPEQLLDAPSTVVAMLNPGAVKRVDAPEMDPSSADVFHMRRPRVGVPDAPDWTEPAYSGRLSPSRDPAESEGPASDAVRDARARDAYESERAETRRMPVERADVFDITRRRRSSTGYTVEREKREDPGDRPAARQRRQQLGRTEYEDVRVVTGPPWRRDIHERGRVRSLSPEQVAERERQMGELDREDTGPGRAPHEWNAKQRGIIARFEKALARLQRSPEYAAEYAQGMRRTVPGTREPGATVAVRRAGEGWPGRWGVGPASERLAGMSVPPSEARLRTKLREELEAAGPMPAGPFEPFGSPDAGPHPGDASGEAIETVGVETVGVAPVGRASALPPDDTADRAVRRRHRDAPVVPPEPEGGRSEADARRLEAGQRGGVAVDRTTGRYRQVQERRYNPDTGRYEAVPEPEPQDPYFYQRAPGRRRAPPPEPRGQAPGPVIARQPGEPRPEGAGAAYRAPRARRALGEFDEPVGTAGETLEHPRTIAQDFARAAGVTLFEGGVAERAPEGTEGLYSPRTGETRVARRDDIESAAHEIGHALDMNVYGRDAGLDQYEASDRPWMRNAQMRQEVESLSYERGIPQEGFAEAFRLWATERAAGDRTAPNAMRAVQDFVDGLPEQQRAAVESAVERMRAWQAAHPGARASARIGRTPPISTGSTWRERVRARIAEARQQTIDSMTHLRDALTDLHGDEAAEVVDSFYTVNSAQQIAGHALRHGAPVWREKTRTVEFMPKLRGRSFEQIVGGLDAEGMRTLNRVLAVMDDEFRGGTRFEASERAAVHALVREREWKRRVEDISKWVQHVQQFAIDAGRAKKGSDKRYAFGTRIDQATGAGRATPPKQLLPFEGTIDGQPAPGRPDADIDPVAGLVRWTEDTIADAMRNAAVRDMRDLVTSKTDGTSFLSRVPDSHRQAARGLDPWAVVDQLKQGIDFEQVVRDAAAMAVREQEVTLDAAPLMSQLMAVLPRWDKRGFTQLTVRDAFAKLRRTERVAEEVETAQGKVALDPLLDALEGALAGAERMPLNQALGQADLRVRVPVATEGAAQPIQAAVMERMLEQSGLLRGMGDAALDAWAREQGDRVDLLAVQGTEPDEPGRHFLTIWDKGEKQIWEIAPAYEGVARSLAAMARPVRGRVWDVISGLRRLHQSGITLDPSFQTASFIRDSMSAWVLSPHGFKPIVDTVRGIGHVLKKSDLYAEAVGAGATTGGQSFDPEAFAKRTARRVQRADGGIAAQAVHALTRFYDAWDRFNQALQEGTNVGLYARARAAGVTGRSAGRAARRATADFAMRGESQAVANAKSAVTFLNAVLVSLDAGYQAAVRGNPGGRAHVWMKMGGLGAASAALYALAAPLKTIGEAEDDVKARKWRIPIPKTDEGLRAWWHDMGKFSWSEAQQHYEIVEIDKPHEYGALATTMEHVIDTFRGRPAGKALGAAVGAVMQNLSLPVQPAIVGPAVEAAANYSFWRGRPIESGRMRSLPAGLRGGHAPETVKAIGRATGVSPVMIDHVANSIFTTAYTLGMAASDRILFGDALPAADWRRAPVVSRLVSPRYRRPEATGRMWDLYRAYREASAGAELLKRDPAERSARRGYILDAREARLGKAFYEATKPHRQRIRRLRSAKRMDPQRRETAIRKLEDKIGDIALRFEAREERRAAQ